MQLLRLQFPHGGPASPLRQATRDALTRAIPGCTDDLVADVLLVISELVQNVSQHTGSDGEFVLSITDGGVLIEVHDSDPASPQLRRPDGRQLGGRGLLLVDGLTGNWGVRQQDTGKTVWACLPVSAAGGALTAA